MAAKKVAMSAKKKLSAKKATAAAKKESAFIRVLGVKVPNNGEPVAIHSYIGPDGKRVRELFTYPEPKRLSPFGEWLMDAHSKGFGWKIVDKNALRLIKKGYSPLEALRMTERYWNAHID